MEQALAELHKAIHGTIRNVNERIKAGRGRGPNLRW